MDMSIVPKSHSDDDGESEEAEQFPTGILPADHPLMKRFQEALREHLMKVQHQLESEIVDLDESLKKKNDEIAEVGSKLFDLQSEVEVQRDSLDKYNKKILDFSDQRKVHEETVARLKSQYEEKDNSSKSLKRITNEVSQEITSMRVLESEISKWNEEIQNEIALAKRVASKDNKDQRLVSEEKKKMDLVLFKLDSEVRKNERTFSNIEDQIREHADSVSSLNKSLADANVDLEGLQQEHKKLMQAWGEVIVSVQHRDKVLSKAKSELL